ncbi:hypothetical protein F7725_021681 [Dissostichus mawsoni]|uniref:SH3 domain-containing protein n=1 Tax=Dissostichus mawsoni TaxID=36200 RepID=A0A7J5ZBX0_DISMA|nr:hypothetical protein F7725_021681 [Dissostichus mawsoni]
MWKSVVGHNVNVKGPTEGDDWETDPDFENDISEQEQRWGAKSVEGSGRQEHISIADLRNKVAAEHEQGKKKEHTPKASYGYGGKFGVEKDRMDKAALGHDYVAQVDQHSSQKDGAQGFGGKYGVQKDRVDKNFLYNPHVLDHSKGFGGKYGVEKEKVDKSALGYDYKGQTEKHQSQKDYAKGFGGKYGVEKDKMDKAALGYDYKGETEKHQSQKDYSKGFGGKFGVEKEKVDKVALGYDYKSETEKHQSQKGFGGRYGVQADRMDKSAAGFSDMDSPSSALQMKKTRRKQKREARRQARESKEREAAKRRQEEESRREEGIRPPPVPDVAPEVEDEMPPPDIQHHMPEIQEISEPEPECTRSPRICPRAQRIPTPWRPPHPPTCLQMWRRREEDEGEYEELADPPPPAPPGLSADVEEDEDEGEYEELADPPPPAPPEADDEISFNPDDVITNIEMIDEGWWKGHCRGRVGLFPAAYVQLSHSSAARSFGSVCSPQLTCSLTQMSSMLDTAAEQMMVEQDFQEAFDTCDRGLESLANMDQEDSRCGELKAGFCMLGMQALAELNQWHGVLSWILQQYEHQEKIPAKIMQIILLYSKVGEPAVMQDAARVWLHCLSNSTMTGFGTVAELYLLHVLVPLGDRDEALQLIQGQVGSSAFSEEQRQTALDVVEEKSDRMKNRLQILGSDQTLRLPLTQPKDL